MDLTIAKSLIAQAHGYLSACLKLLEKKGV
jgi:hypothetical protein